MHTARLLTVSQHALRRGCVSQHALGKGCLPWWVYLSRRGCTCPGGVPAQGVYLPGVYLPRGCTCPGGCTCLGVYLLGGCTCLEGVPAQGVYLPRRCTYPGGCTCPGGVPAREVYLPRGCIPACNGADTPCGQTDTCENITFANFVCGR